MHTYTHIIESSERHHRRKKGNWLFAWLFFDALDEASMFLRSVGELLPDDMTSYPRRYIELVTTVRTSNPTSTRFPCSVCTLDNWYKYYVFGRHPSSYLYLKHRPVYFFKIQHFGDWNLSPCSGKTYGVGPSLWRQGLALPIGHN
jgi:hypothetical protein